MGGGGGVGGEFKGWGGCEEHCIDNFSIFLYFKILL